jgi:hypothetical protein
MRRRPSRRAIGRALCVFRIGTAPGSEFRKAIGSSSSFRRTKKCTEPVSPLSGFPTDRRRSDCLSGSHQPRALRTRCKPHTRGAGQPRQGRLERTLRKLRSFLFAQAETAIHRVCSESFERRKRAGPEGPTARKFAEPGTLSSTFPTNLPLPRSAPRGASSYRRPVLGAAGMYEKRRVRSRGLETKLLANCGTWRSRVDVKRALRPRTRPP